MKEERGNRQVIWWPWVMVLLAILAALVMDGRDSPPPSSIGLQPQGDSLSSADTTSQPPSPDSVPADVLAAPDAQPASGRNNAADDGSLSSAVTKGKEDQE